MRKQYRNGVAVSLKSVQPRIGFNVPNKNEIISCTARLTDADKIREMRASALSGRTKNFPSELVAKQRMWPSCRLLCFVFFTFLENDVTTDSFLNVSRFPKHSFLDVFFFDECKNSLHFIIELSFDPV